MQLNLRKVYPSKWKPHDASMVIADHIKLRRYEILFTYIGEKSMKYVFILLCGALFTLTSCGISSRYSSSGNEQMFSDAIYSSSPTRRDKNAEETSKEEVKKLTQKTQSSQIYLYGDIKDTVVIPENMAAHIKYDKLSGTSITVAEFDPYDYRSFWYADVYRWNDPYWYYGSRYSWHHHRWHNPWYYGSIHSPWYHGSWYDPWYYGGFYGSYYGGFYDPWYYGGFYDPWYYGYAGWYDPFYPYMRPHCYGWYGGWGPSYHHHHHHVSHPSGGHLKGREVYRGSNLETSGKRAIAGTPASAPSSGKNTNRVATTSRRSFGTSTTNSTRQVQGRSATSYRRPTGTTSSRSTGSSTTPAYTRSSSSNASSSYNRSSSSHGGSYTSPSRSSYSSGSSSGGGYTRSSSSSGSGYSRSSSGGRR